MHTPRSVPIARTVVLRTDDQTSTLFRALVDSFQDVDNLLLIFQNPIQLIIVSRPKITHHVFISKEEHDGARVVELVHLLEIGHLVQIAEVNYGKVLDTVGNLVEYFVLTHAVWIPIATEADDDQSVLLGHNGLVDVPCGGQMGNDDGTHGSGGICLGVAAMRFR